MRDLPKPRLSGSRYRTFAAWDRARELSRDAKRRRRGTCERCGAETRYNGHSAPVSRHCVTCANRLKGEAVRGTGFRQQTLYRLLREHGSMRYSQIRDTMLLSDGNVSQMLDHELKGGRIVRVRRGVYALPDRFEARGNR